MPDDSSKSTRVRVAAVILREDQILLAQHEKGGKRYWLLPGGGMEYGESVEEALKRELLEEASLEIEVGDLLWVVDSIPADHHRHVLNLILSAGVRSGEVQPHPDSVLRDVLWVPLASLDELTLFPDTKDEILRYVRTGERGNGLLGKRWK